MNRRNFLRTGGLTALPVLAPAIPALARRQAAPAADNKAINFLNDGIFLSTEEYVAQLADIVATQKTKKRFLR